MRLCPYCDEYARGRQNYCRMCGAHLTAGEDQHTPVPAERDPVEKYCGHCGRLFSQCPGDHDR